MSDYELGARVYAGVVAKQQNAVEAYASQQDMADIILSEQSEPEENLRIIAAEVATGLGRAAIRQILHPRASRLLHPGVTLLGFGNYVADTPLLDVEDGQYQELAVKYGWVLRIKVPSRIGGVLDRYEKQELRTMAAFDILRVAQPTIDYSAGSAESWYRVNTHRPPGRIVESMTAARDTELGVMQAALKEYHKSKLRDTSNIQSYSKDEREVNERYRSDFERLPTAGLKAITHASSILLMAQSELQL